MSLKIRALLGTASHFCEVVVLSGGACLHDVGEVGHLLLVLSSRFESLILSHHSRYKVTCECNEEDINDDDDDKACLHDVGEVGHLLLVL